MCYDQKVIAQVTESCMRSLFLSSYLAYATKNGLLSPAMTTSYANQLQAMQGMIYTFPVT